MIGTIWRIRKWFLGGAEPDALTVRQQLKQALKPAQLTDLLSQRDLDGLDLQVHLEHAHPADYVLDVASRAGAYLVVMGTVARTGVPGFFIGNTAERIVSRLRCSALTVKPGEFHTPIV